MGDRRGGTESRTPWQEPDSYTYTLQSSAGERSLLGTLHAIDDEALYIISAYKAGG